MIKLSTFAKCSEKWTKTFRLFYEQEQPIQGNWFSRNDENYYFGKQTNTIQSKEKLFHFI